jgi:glycosyltransferase involved in cell wall biosynthesis
MTARPLRICFVAYRGNMNCGGQGVYLWFLARELARRGHHVDVLVGPPYPDAMPFAGEVEHLPNEQFWAKWFLGDSAALLPRPDPLRIFSPLNFYELAASRLGFLPEPFAFSLRALRALAARIRRGVRYDVVHDVQCLGYGLLGMRAIGLPVVTTVHHPLSVDRRASFLRDTNLSEAIGSMKFYPLGMQAFVARRLERVMTSSETSRALIHADFGVAPERIRMIGNGLDTELFRPDPAASRNDGELLCVGRAADPTKGVRTLIRALGELGPEVRLTLVDSASSGNDALRWAREAGCEDRLRLTGRVETKELVGLYRRAALVVVPSRFEGFGLPAAEAMACGTPVVATNAGALPEVLAAGGAGVLVPVDDPGALAKAIAELLAQPERRREMSAHAHARIAAAYAWPAIAARTEEVYLEAVAAR